MSELKDRVYALVTRVAKAEKVTREALGEFSRSALAYVLETDDIDVVNRMVNVLTPMNRRTAILFFREFLPWEEEKDADGNHVRFGKRSQKNKVVDKKSTAIAEFLADENSTIWTWAKENVSVEKTPDYMGNLERALKTVLAGNEKKGVAPANPIEVIDHIMRQISAEDMGTYLEQQAVVRAEAAQKYLTQPTHQVEQQQAA